MYTLAVSIPDLNTDRRSNLHWKQKLGFFLTFRVCSLPVFFGSVNSSSHNTGELFQLLLAYVWLPSLPCYHMQSRGKWRKLTTHRPPQKKKHTWTTTKTNKHNNKQTKQKHRSSKHHQFFMGLSSNVNGSLKDKQWMFILVFLQCKWVYRRCFLVLLDLPDLGFTCRPTTWLCVCNTTWF